MSKIFLFFINFYFFFIKINIRKSGKIGTEVILRYFSQVKGEIIKHYEDAENQEKSKESMP